MSQMSSSDFEYAGKRKQTRREPLPRRNGSAHMLWTGLRGLIEPFYPKAGGDRKPYPLETILRIHHVAELILAERSAHGRSALRNHTHAPVRTSEIEPADLRRHHDHELPALAGEAPARPYAPAILAFNGYLQEKGLSLRQGSIVNATIIHAQSSTKNEEGERDPEIHQTKKRNQYLFGVKAHMGADVESGLVHHVHGSAANMADATQVAELLHGEENAVYADPGYTGVEKREEDENREVVWEIAARRNTYSKLNKRGLLYKSQAQDAHAASSSTDKPDDCLHPSDRTARSV